MPPNNKSISSFIPSTPVICHPYSNISMFWLYPPQFLIPQNLTFKVNRKYITFTYYFFYHFNFEFSIQYKLRVHKFSEVISSSSQTKFTYKFQSKPHTQKQKCKLAVLTEQQSLFCKAMHVQKASIDSLVQCKI